uniref:Uncharacterized protein n=1 Tax=viral metagenome TaxID=1070528 RepID=A0A2V0RKA4_9ZZZZ
MSNTEVQRGRNLVKRRVTGGQVTFSNQATASPANGQTDGGLDGNQVDSGEPSSPPPETQEEYDARRKAEIEAHNLLDELGTRLASEIAAYNEEHWAEEEGSADRYGIKDLHRDTFTTVFDPTRAARGEEGPMTDEEINEMENAALTLSAIIDSMGTVGGFSSDPKVKTKATRLNNISLFLNKGVDISRALRSGDVGRMYNEMGPFGTIRAIATGEGTGQTDRFLTTYVQAPGALFTGGPQAAIDTLLVPGVNKQQEKPFIQTIGDTFTNVFSAASEYDSYADKIASKRGIRILEEDRYYVVRYDPHYDITYVEWRPTTDIKNLLTQKGFSGAVREWSEDALAALGYKVPAWTRRVQRVKEKYGEESEKVVHYGYSRGGGLATHMGGTGYGTGYFSRYLPKRGSRSKYSGDVIHDYLINPLSVALLWRNLHRV